MSKRLKKEEPQLQKNDCCTVVIEDMSANGEGIGKYCGYTLFVKDAVIGDEALVRVTRAKKQYGYARLEQLITPSKNRVEAVCEHHKRCGGCQIQALAYEQQLMFKRNKIENNLRRLGGLDVRVETMVGMEQPFYYRNKTQIPFGRNKEGKIVAGFYAGRTHSIVDCEDCALAAPVTGEIVRRIKRFMEECSVEPYDERTGQGIVRHSLIRTGWYTGQIMVCIVINADRLPRQERLVQSLSRVDGMTSISLSINKENTNVVMGNEVRTIWGSEVITDRLEDLTFAISPLSFFQVNTRQAERLYQKALEFAGLTGTETVWDLYCGIGTISLFLARRARQVYGVEVVPQAIEDANANARRNGISNVEFFVGKAEEVLPRKRKNEGVCADVIVVDPPRKGCDEELLRTIVEMEPDRVVYVSCDSATLARDLKFLTGAGYEVKRCAGVDLFGMTVHVETVVLLSKLNTKQHIEVELNLDELDLTAAESKATYEEIKGYVLEKYGLKVSSLYISQVKRKCGLDVGKNYNLSKKADAKVPQCPSEKEAAIMEALKYFSMI